MSAAIVNEPGRVVMEGEWVEEIVLDIAWPGTDHIEELNDLFEIVKGSHQAGTDYYQGMDFMGLIRRKSDGRLFGYPYWSSPGNDGMETQLDANGENHGFENEFNADFTEYIRGPFWVWLPVETFEITGYRLVTDYRADTATTHPTAKETADE
jgi:hypothetical protein